MRAYVRAYVRACARVCNNLKPLKFLSDRMGAERVINECQHRFRTTLLELGKEAFSQPPSSIFFLQRMVSDILGEHD